MLDFCVLGSGSSGNASVIRTQNTMILIDAGFSALRLKKKLEELRIGLERISAILLTHEHTDHSQALGQITKKYKIPVMGPRHTCMYLKEKAPNASWINFEKGSSFQIGDITVMPFATSHDAVDPVGFRMATTDGTLGFLSDTGCCNTTIARSLEHVDALYIESNYDPHLLETTPKRPWPLKQRIASRHGHLSNQQAAEFVEQIAHGGLRHIILGHLSGESNTEEIAMETMARTITRTGFSDTTLSCSRQHEILPWISVG